MTVRQRQSAALAAVVAVLAVGAIIGHFHAERALLAEWRSLAEQARTAGLVLRSDRARRSGWPLEAILSIDHPRLAAPPLGLSVASELVRLRRPMLHPGPLTIDLPRPVTVDAFGERWQAWGDELRAVSDLSGATALRAASLRVAIGDGPDDILTVARLVGRAREQDGGVGLAFETRGVVLPLARVAAADRVVRRALVAVRIEPKDRRLVLERVDLDWNGLAVDLTGALTAPRSGSLSGRLSLTLGPGWRSAIRRAETAGLVDAAQARAALGVISLVAPHGAVRDLPLAVQDGRVSFGGLKLLTLPALR